MSRFAKDALTALGYQKECKSSPEQVLELIGQRLTSGEKTKLLELLKDRGRRGKHWEDSIIMQEVMRYMVNASGKLTCAQEEKIAIYTDNSLIGQEQQLEWEAAQNRHAQEHGAKFTPAVQLAAKSLNMTPDKIHKRLKKIEYLYPSGQWATFKATKKLHQ